MGKSGQAGVSVMRKAATDTEPERIYVYASCDSLAVQCESYRRTINTMSSNYKHQINALEEELLMSQRKVEELEHSSNCIWPSLKWFFSGIVIGIVLTFIKLKK